MLVMPLDGEEIINIVLAPWNLSDEYNRHCGVTMVSILENSNSIIAFHILYDEHISNNNATIW